MSTEPLNVCERRVAGIVSMELLNEYERGAEEIVSAELLDDHEIMSTKLLDKNEEEKLSDQSDDQGCLSNPEDEDEGGHITKHKLAEFNKDKDMKNPKLSEGMVFLNVHAFKALLKEFHIREGLEYTYLKNKATRVTFICKEKCGFRKYINKYATAKWIAGKYMENLTDEPNKNVMILKNDVRREWMLDVSSIISQKAQPEDYVNKAYTTDTFVRTYSHRIKPILDKSLWPQTECDPRMPPPLRMQFGGQRRLGEKERMSPIILSRGRRTGRGRGRGIGTGTSGSVGRGGGRGIGSGSVGRGNGGGIGSGSVATGGSVAIGETVESGKRKSVDQPQQNQVCTT
ncbi:hypothetical protein RHMOL_Rhmol09G0131600 [Rhododendron molle]|uniref:Uncharacterized protein n=1 Tax=Rhododendron molle TaxID=49168 RepID=A0ACC0MDY7_RHOML|nr:hypothetical protein RHMOL_Rhmol09G0131600 [Rhododendron molle]